MVVKNNIMFFKYFSFPGIFPKGILYVSSFPGFDTYGFPKVPSFQADFVDGGELNYCMQTDDKTTCSLNNHYRFCNSFSLPEIDTYRILTVSSFPGFNTSGPPKVFSFQADFVNRGELN
jgi:hypothetical protein